MRNLSGARQPEVCMVCTKRMVCTCSLNTAHSKEKKNFSVSKGEISVFLAHLHMSSDEDKIYIKL